MCECAGACLRECANRASDAEFRSFLVVVLVSAEFSGEDDLGSDLPVPVRLVALDPDVVDGGMCDLGGLEEPHELAF